MTEARRLTDSEVRLIREWAGGVSSRKAAHFFHIGAYDAKHYASFVSYLEARGYIAPVPKDEQKGFSPSLYALTEQGIDWLIRCGITKEDAPESPVNEYAAYEEALEACRNAAVISVSEAAREFADYDVDFGLLLTACKAGDIPSAFKEEGKWYGALTDFEAYSGRHWTHVK